MSYKKPYKGVPYQPCQKCGRMAYTWNYCPSCAQKIHEEWLRKQAENRNNSSR